MQAVIRTQADIITLQASQINNLIALGQNTHDRLLFLESEVRTLVEPEPLHESGCAWGHCTRCY